MKFIVSLIFATLFCGASAFASSFSECPSAGYDTNGCEFLITVTAAKNGAATSFTVATASPDQGPYDGSDDTLVGILNKSGSKLTSVSLSSNTDIFGFDGDGICTVVSCPGATDPSGYAPAGVTFSNINTAQTSGTVNFSLANGASTFFSLEEALTASQIMPGNPSPEPTSILLMGFGFAGMGLVARRFRATK